MRTNSAGFEFSLKLVQDFTYERKVTDDDVNVFKRGIEPLAKAEKLGGAAVPVSRQMKRDDGQGAIASTRQRNVT